MNANQIEVLLFVLAPAVASMAAGLIATVRPPGGKVRGAILHFAGGVVFSVVAVELIPDLLREHAPVYTTLGFALGVATMLGVRALLESDETGEEGELDLTNAPTNGRASNSPRSSIPMAMLIATGVDLGVDGILLGIGDQEGKDELTIHRAPLRAATRRSSSSRSDGSIDSTASTSAATAGFGPAPSRRLTAAWARA